MLWLTGLDEVRLVVYERAGGLTVVRASGGELIDAAVTAAAGPPAPSGP